MRAHEFITEISRRNLLKGAAAGAIAGAALSPFLLKQKEIEQAPHIEVKKQPSTISNNKSIESILMKYAIAAKIEGVELAQFMAQCYHETGGFSYLKEKGGPRYFKKLYDITQNPKLATVLGNLHLGDGIRFHGRGFIHLTGRENYKKASKIFGVDLEKNPALAEDPELAAKIAVWYWKARVRPVVSDFYNTSAATKPINSRLKGLESREAAFEKYLATMK